MDDMTRYLKQSLLIGGVVLILCLLRIRKLMLDDDLEIPEFMVRTTCNEVGCMKKSIPGVDKCLECAIADALPKLYDELDEILAKS